MSEHPKDARIEDELSNKLEWQIHCKKLEDTITVLESRCESYQKEIHSVDLVCHMLRQENHILKSKLHATENSVLEIQSLLFMNSMLSENTIAELRMNLSSSKSELEYFRDVVNKNRISVVKENYMIVKSASDQKANNSNKVSESATMDKDMQEISDRGTAGAGSTVGTYYDNEPNTSSSLVKFLFLKYLKQFC